ncbi:MAG: hypothetical protein DRQ47_11235 [Gammaproteobacteria bacterium]|nr:MAG: hypothetical protein DRQ47_11235 [Gammaproteobacteria bacterium]
MSEGVLNAHSVANLHNMEEQVKLGNEPTLIGDVKQAEIDIDILTTLVSLSRMQQGTKENVASIMRHEYARDPVNNGFQAMMNMHKNFKEDALKQNFDGNKVLMAKGYTQEMYDTHRAIKVAPKSQEAQLLDEGYKKQYRITKDKNSSFGGDMWMYVSTASDKTARVSGIYSYTSKISMGYDLVEQFTNMGGTGRDIQKEFNAIRKRNAQDVAKQFKGRVKLDYDNNYMIPIMSPQTGGALNFRYTMSEQHKEQLLGKNDMAHKVLSRMIASSYNKKASEEGNLDFYQLAKTDFDREFHKTPNEFVEISPRATGEHGKLYREYYKMMPEHERIQMERVFGYNKDGSPKPLMVREDLIDMIFGYHKLSLTTWIDTLVKKVTGGKHGMPYFMKQIMRHTGIIWQKIIGRAKRNIVLFIPAVLQQNVISNSILLMLNGVSPMAMMRDQAEAFSSLQEYQQDHKEMLRLGNLIRTFPNDPKVPAYTIKMNQLKVDLDRNPVRHFIDEGIFQLIVEDIDSSDADDTVVEALANAIPGGKTGLDIAGEKIPVFIKDGFRQLTIAPDTKLSNAMTNATAYSDFVARYSLYKHLTKKGGKYPVDKDGRVNQNALQITVDTFINYDVPTQPHMQWLNDMGILMFTKFFLRIQKIILRIFRDAPAALVSKLLIDQFIFDQDSIEDQFAPTASFFDHNGIMDALGRADDATNLNLLSLLGHLPGIDTNNGLNPL